MSTDALEAKGRFGCPLCTDRFASVGDKKRHMHLYHPKPVKP